jgi:hypothetical protein
MLIQLLELVLGLTLEVMTEQKNRQKLEICTVHLMTVEVLLAIVLGCQSAQQKDLGCSFYQKSNLYSPSYIS